jgi:hypothetical protein
MGGGKQGGLHIYIPTSKSYFCIPKWCVIRVLNATRLSSYMKVTIRGAPFKKRTL